MSNIALVISNKEISSKLASSRFAREIFKSILYFSRKKELVASIREINLYENLK